MSPTNYRNTTMLPQEGRAIIERAPGQKSGDEVQTRWPRFSPASFHPCIVAGHSLPRAQCLRVKIKSLEESTLWGGARGAVSGGERILSNLYAAVRCTIQNSPRNSDRSFSRRSPCTRAWFPDVPRRRKCSAMSVTPSVCPSAPLLFLLLSELKKRSLGNRTPWLWLHA